MGKRVKLAKKKEEQAPNQAPDDKKGKTLADLLAGAVRTKFGEDSLLKMSGTGLKPVPISFSTGIPTIDYDLLGIGGIPMSRLIEIIGPESSGKTTLCLHIAAACQRAGGTVAFVDAEHALDLKYATSLGVKVEDVLLNQPSCGEEGLEIVETMLKTKQTMSDQSKPLLLIVDSIAALIPRKEIEGELENNDAGLGAHARLMSTALKRLLPAAKGVNAVVIFTNQIRQKIGVTYGSNETTPGGNAMKFYASIRMDIRNIGKEKVGDEVIGNNFRLKTIKNKTYPPFREIKGLMRFGIGIDLLWDKFTILKDRKIITQKAAWYTVKVEGEPKFCGYKGFQEFYEQNVELVENLLKETLKS